MSADLAEHFIPESRRLLDAQNVHCILNDHSSLRMLWHQTFELSICQSGLGDALATREKQHRNLQLANFIPIDSRITIRSIVQQSVDEDDWFAFTTLGVMQFDIVIDHDFLGWLSDHVELDGKRQEHEAKRSCDWQSELPSVQATDEAVCESYPRPLARFAIHSASDTLPYFFG